MANQSRVLYETNLVEGVSSVAYSGTEISGFEKENAYDYLDFSTFKPQVSATTNLDFTLNADKQISSIGMFIKKVGGSGLNIILKYESSPSTYTTLGTYNDVDGDLTFNTFGQVTVSSGRKIRLEITSDATQYEIRQIIVGPYLEFQRGQYVGVNPPTMIQGRVLNNSISVNGALIGSTVKREKVTTRIEQEFLTESWARSSWEAFSSRASSGKGFFYQWNPSQYPSEVVYCMAQKVDAPENISPTPLMRAGLTAICRQPDE